jgi:hypothetical protein
MHPLAVYGPKRLDFATQEDYLAAVEEYRSRVPTLMRRLSLEWKPESKYPDSEPKSK